MEAKFITFDHGVIDLTPVNFSVTENNSRVNDGLFTKYTFPFTVYADDRFLRQFGDYLSPATEEPENRIPGFFVFEGKSHEGVINIETIKGNKLTGQIDFGFEDLPNFDKKLAELPLERYEVTNIYDVADIRVKQDYPATNFNFPRIYNPKYINDSELWKTFDGYLNDMKKDQSGMRRNYIDDDGKVFNVNILHPCPHVLYLLKTGFESAGYRLTGDVLTDPVLQDKWVYSGTDLFTTKHQKRYGYNFTSADFDSYTGSKHKYAHYRRKIMIEDPGKYLLSGKLEFWKAKKYHADYSLELNGSVIWKKNASTYRRRDSILEDVYLNLPFNVTSSNSELVLIIETQFHPNWTHQLANLLLTSEKLDEKEEPDEESNVITNINEVNLPGAVPDITFGEFVKIIKNWFNYDIGVDGRTVTMNRLGDKSVHDVKDFRQFEEDPSRDLINNRTYFMKFPDLDVFEKDSMIYSVDGSSLNGKEEEATDVIEIQGYHLPVKRPEGLLFSTAYVCKDAQDLVQLVGYRGTNTGNNNAAYDRRCDFPELFRNNWERWLRQRIRGQDYRWEFFCTPADLHGIDIKDYIYAYGQNHIIKTWTKNKISEEVYQVEIVTETVV